MKTVKIDSKTINSWETFHNVFSQKFNFPSYYGRNMNAWIDCMDELNNELTLIDLGDCRELKERNPEIIEAINECSAFVNYRKIEAGESAVITISMFV
ncbi:barstar family protein [Aquimarina sp. Aq78]|uniref:barstar family protein n=1 Tax=Aquimarina sp. Aq78 TaxID=1191889 RepID=UPI000D10AD39|nr:barstar family protein [Aquimarina sp. Aq78]